MNPAALLTLTRAATGAVLLTALWIGAAVDTVHAASAAGLAVSDPRRQRDALGNAFSALVFAGAGAELARRGRRR